MKTEVKKFYSEIQFNTGEEKIVQTVGDIHAADVIPSKTLQTLLDIEMFMDVEGVTDVLELGCGNGWLSNRIATNYPHLDITGIDIAEPQIEYAKSSCCDYQDDECAKFHVEDIMDTHRTADLVISIGALHHIPNYSMYETITKALECAERFAFIGLYHKESRNAMFEWFKQFPEKEWYNIFTELTPYLIDDTQRRSWFQDQFYAPYEKMVDFDILNQVSMRTDTKILSTSFEEDIDYAQRVIDKLNNKEFTSGFVYTLFDRTNSIDSDDEELLKQRIDDIRKNDPYIYR